MNRYVFEIESDVAAPLEEVWRQATDMGAVNLELRPLVRMTYPGKIRDLHAAVISGRYQPFRSWILLYGVVPIDCYKVTVVAFEPHHRFLERSQTWNYHRWEHERVLESLPRGTRIKDRVTMEPRLGCLGALSGGFARAIFRLRHRNLMRLFDQVGPATRCGKV